MNALQKTFNVRNVTHSKQFDNYEKAMDWCKKLEEAGSLNGEVALESNRKGIWKVYW